MALFTAGQDLDGSASVQDASFSLSAGASGLLGKVINSFPFATHLETGRQELVGASCGAGCRVHCLSSGKKSVYIYIYFFPFHHSFF